MRAWLTIAAFTVAVSGTYTGIAQLLPQLENHPPASVELGSSIGPEDLSAAGAGVFAASCVQCHKLGAKDRCPDLARAGELAHGRAVARAAATGEPYTDVDYLVEALCRPGAHLVEGYGNLMPPQGKTLSGGQLLAAVAFLQDQGGVASVKGTDTKAIERFGCAGAPAAGAAPEPVGTPEQVFVRFACAACHKLDGSERLLGPSLEGVGKRLAPGALYEAILDPDATLAAGTPPFPGGLMKATLDGNGFYARMTAADYKALVAWLAARPLDSARDRDGGT